MKAGVSIYWVREANRGYLILFPEYLNSLPTKASTIAMLSSLKLKNIKHHFPGLLRYINHRGRDFESLNPFR